jgi:hypothetical protein
MDALIQTLQSKYGGPDGKLAFINGGAFKRVYRGFDNKRRKPVAVKVPNANGPLSEQKIRERFVEEISLLDDCHGHEHIERFLQWEETETIYVVAARWRQKRLENLLVQALPSQDSAGREAAVAEILSLMKGADEHTAQILGLAYSSFSFQHGRVAPGTPPSAAIENEGVAL